MGVGGREMPPIFVPLIMLVGFPSTSTCPEIRTECALQALKKSRKLIIKYILSYFISLSFPVYKDKNYSSATNYDDNYPGNKKGRGRCCLIH